ncbi:hypothetical protein BHE74_00026464 [Ensete ventricosum]|nr:hypothetical protein GW17_00003963 [Ensete ventricosum]RWW66200.1 hypothetical protein BHE74_00026464 [Ensete ventricosum]
MAPPRATFHCSLATRRFELAGSEPLVRPQAIPAVGWRADGFASGFAARMLVSRRAMWPSAAFRNSFPISGV